VACACSLAIRFDVLCAWCVCKQVHYYICVLGACALCVWIIVRLRGGGRSVGGAPGRCACSSIAPFDELSKFVRVQCVLMRVQCVFDAFTCALGLCI
jgi:hypothetical protein